MKWNRNVNEIPPKTEVLVLTDLGELLLAWRNRKNGRYLDVKAATRGKIEWLKNEIDLKVKWGKDVLLPDCLLEQDRQSYEETARRCI